MSAENSIFVLKRCDKVSGGRVPNLCRLIQAHAEHLPAIWTEADALNVVCMPHRRNLAHGPVAMQERRNETACGDMIGRIEPQHGREMRRAKTSIAGPEEILRPLKLQQVDRLTKLAIGRV